MRELMPKIAIILLLVAIVGLPILLRPSDASESNADGSIGPRLVIYTPHNEQIRYEIENAYNDWRQANGQPTVVFDWRTPGGTSDIRKSILSQFQALIGTDKGLDGGIGVDLFFGGGEYDHKKVAGGITTEDKEGIENTHRIVMDPQIDAELFEAAFPQPLIGGEKLYAKFAFEEINKAGQLQTNEIVGWTGVTLSSFGIVYNRDSLQTLGIDEPTTWSDLGDSRLQGWVALADPGHSGSISATFETILKREGWTEGWKVLKRAFANARYFATSSDRVPVDVSRGDAAMGMCIDFYGRYQTGMVGDRRMGYADPVEDGRSMTATTADPITLLRGAPTPALAREFISWLLQPDAQSLWQRSLAKNADDELVRPEQYELRRQPLRADLYTDESRASWVDQQLDPYATAVPFPKGTPSYFSMVAPITKTMAIDIHKDLIAAWKALNKARDANHPKLAEIEKLFYAMPPELVLNWPDDELANNWRAIHYKPDHPRYGEVVATLEAFSDALPGSDEREAKHVTWRNFYQNNYRQVIKLAGE